MTDQSPPEEPLARPIQACTQTIFPTPVSVHEWPASEELNAALRDLILAEEARGPGGVARSNVGGWHSDTGFLNRPDPPIRHLVQRIRTMIRALSSMLIKPGQHRFAVEGWANVLRRGQYNAIHLHPNSTWSGVYYVTGNPPPDGEGNPDFSGKIEFIDPRPGASASYTVENVMQQRSMLNPGPGTMIAFPSWLQHQVHPYFGPGERISIAYNVLITQG